MGHSTCLLPACPRRPFWELQGTESVEVRFSLGPEVRDQVGSGPIICKFTTGHHSSSAAWCSHTVSVHSVFIEYGMKKRTHEQMDLCTDGWHRLWPGLAAQSAAGKIAPLSPLPTEEAN